MQRLSLSEEQVILLLWCRPGGTSIREIIGAPPAPIPPYTTLASTLPQLVGKGYARVEKRGRHNWFIPHLSGAAYAGTWLARFVTVHFAGSYTELVRFCVRQGQVSPQGPRELLDRLPTH